MADSERLQPVGFDRLESPVRTHPDLFTPDEAAAYLHLDSVRSLETLREHFGLIGFGGVNRGFLYWREDLDKCALRIVGRGDGYVTGGGKMRLAGARGR